MRLKIEAQLDYATQDLRTILLQIVAAENVADQTVVESALDINDVQSHVRVPADEGVGTRSWIEVRDRFTCTYRATVDILRPQVDLGLLAQVALPDLPGEVV